MSQPLISEPLVSSGGIMHLTQKPGGAEKIVRFYREHDPLPEDDTCHIEYLEIDRGLWEEHGSPEVLTVTIRAGDQYN